MQKEYYIKRTSLWFLAKVAVYTLVILTFWRYIYIIIIVDFSINWWIYDHGPIDFLKSYVIGIKDILFHKGGLRFVIGIYEENVKTKDGNFLYSEIARYEISRGGSEPYLILKNGRRVDLNVSWLTKEEQLEIEKYLQERINDSQESR